MSNKSKKIRPVRSARTSSHFVKKQPANSFQSVLCAALVSFVCGVGICVALLAVFALLLTHTPLPLTAVRPFACAAAAAGATVAGLVLARKVGRQLLLCGFACGCFYAICQMTAAFIVSGAIMLQSGDVMLSIVMLFGGLLGGAIAALGVAH